MRYTIQSIKYVLKNFFYLLPLAILPAFFLSISTDNEAILCAIETLLSGKPTDFHFIHIFRAISILSFTSWRSAISGFFGIISLVVCAALLMALLEKHMRIGKRTFNGIFSKLNDNLVPTFGYVILVLAIYELWTLIVSVLLFFVSNITIVPLAYVAMAIVFIVAHMALLYAIGVIYLWLPCMQITGFKAVEALYYANHLSSSVQWKISLGQLLSWVVAEAIIVLCVMLSQSIAMFLGLTTICYAILIMVYCVRMEVVYFSLDNIQRADLNRYYQR